MLVDTENMIPVTKLQKELTQRLRKVSETGEPLFILRNNEMAAVVLSADEYQMLKNAEEILEHFEIAEVIEKRFKDHDRSQNVPWEKIKKKHAV